MDNCVTAPAMKIEVQLGFNHTDEKISREFYSLVTSFATERKYIVPTYSASNLDSPLQMFFY